jgi:uncharacterized protein (DUF433 family)
MVSDPNVMMGKPMVRGTGITAESIVERLGAAESIEAIVDAHPRRTREAVLAAVSFASKALKGNVVYPIPPRSA